MSVVTVNELANYMGGWKFTPIQRQDAEAILDGVQSELERYINRPLQMRRVVEVVDVDRYGIAYVKITPIVAVHGIYRNDRITHGPGEPYSTVPSNYFRPGSNYLALGGFGRVHIDYTGGVNADLDPGVKLAIKRVAAREFLYKHDDSVTLANTEARPPEDADPQPKGWSEEELKKFDRMRRRVVL